MIRKVGYQAKMFLFDGQMEDVNLICKPCRENLKSECGGCKMIEKKANRIVRNQGKTQIRDQLLIEQTAKELGLQLSGFFTNKSLELYYDIKRCSHDLGYISKGWNDPGFRIGNLIKIPPHSTQNFNEIAYELLLNYCVTNGIGITFKELKNDLEVHLTSVIYQEGFNKKTFIKTLETLNECVEKIKSLNIPGGNIRA